LLWQLKLSSSDEAWSKSRQGNKYKRWPSRHNSDCLSPISTPVAQTSFKIKPEEKIFCIGSCFANEISQALYRLDYNVLSIFHDLPTSTSTPHETTNDAIFHKYNVAAIYNELAWALDHEISYQYELALIKVNDDYV
jgi:2-keto-4-pentenoate hydratase/2-oxohepta-3-ene-1,7-dioic acid hydratase in catechol pathway